MGSSKASTGVPLCDIFCKEPASSSVKERRT